MSEPLPQDHRPDPDRPRTGPARRDRSPWLWLLAVPVLLLIWPPLYNRNDPELAGIPFFYWYQLAVVPIGVLCTVLVYRQTRREGGER